MIRAYKVIKEFQVHIALGIDVDDQYHVILSKFNVFDRVYLILWVIWKNKYIRKGDIKEAWEYLIRPKKFLNDAIESVHAND